MVRLGTGLVVLFVLLPLCMGWWTVEEDRKKETHSETSSSENTNKMVPFEVMTAEQKFLQEANHLLNLSPLDSCQHKVHILLLKGSRDITGPQHICMCVGG